MVREIDAVELQQRLQAGEGIGPHELPHPQGNQVRGHETDIHGLEAGAQGCLGRKGLEKDAPPHRSKQVVRVTEGYGQSQHKKVPDISVFVHSYPLVNVIPVLPITTDPCYWFRCLK